MSDPKNPYEAPHADPNATVPAPLAAIPMAMPAPVKATVGIIVALALIVGYSAFAQGTLPWGQLGIMAVLLWGVVRQSALAWQYVRVMGTLAVLATGTIMLSLALGNRSPGHPKIHPLVMGTSLLLETLYLIPVLLMGTKPARRYFNVICPACGSVRVKALDFLYRERRCKLCQTTWR